MATKRHKTWSDILSLVKDRPEGWVSDLAECKDCLSPSVIALLPIVLLACLLEYISSSSSGGGIGAAGGELGCVLDAEGCVIGKVIWCKIVEEDGEGNVTENIGLHYFPIGGGAPTLNYDGEWVPCEEAYPEPGCVYPAALAGEIASFPK